MYYTRALATQQCTFFEESGQDGRLSIRCHGEARGYVFWLLGPEIMGRHGRIRLGRMKLGGQVGQRHILGCLQHDFVHVSEIRLTQVVLRVLPITGLNHNLG